MEFCNKVLATTFLLLGAASSGSYAASESLLADNSTLATAQAVGLFNHEGVINVFGLRGTIDLFGTLIVDDDNADYYSFDITTPSIITLSVDTPEGPFFDHDPIVGLFAPNGSKLLVDDDSGPGWDSLLSMPVYLPGIYYAAVSGFSDFDFVSVPGSSTNWSYILQITATPVPVPAAAWLLGSALFALALRRRSRG